MKKINSIGYGHKLLGAIAVFLVVLPACCSFFFTVFHTDFFKIIASVSLGIGIAVSLFFIGLLLVEFHQDRVIDHQYATLRKTKMIIGNGMYECQSCGYRQVRATDRVCNICGICFLQESRRENEN